MLGAGLAWLGVALATVPLTSAALRGSAAAVGAALALPFPIITAFRAATGASWETPRHVAFLALALVLLGTTAESLAPVPKLYFVSIAAFAPVAAVVSIGHAAGSPIGDDRWEDAVLGAPLAGTFATIALAFAVSRPRRLVSTLFVAAALLQLLASGVLGVVLAASDPLRHRADTQLVSAHLHFALLGFGLCALLALAHATWPRLRARAGLAGLALLVAGTAVLSIAEAVAGNRGMPRRVSDYAPMFAGENLAAAIGGGLTNGRGARVRLERRRRGATSCTAYVETPLNEREGQAARQRLAHRPILPDPRSVSCDTRRSSRRSSSRGRRSWRWLDFGRE
jgi:hypothetical protein